MGDIFLHNLRPDPGARRHKKRVGRGEGSGLGKTAGRGNKGSKQRSGGRISPRYEGGQMPLHMRLPKLRGPLAKTAMPIGPFRTYMTPINLSRLAVFAAGGEGHHQEGGREDQDPGDRGAHATSHHQSPRL